MHLNLMRINFEMLIEVTTAVISGVIASVFMFFLGYWFARSLYKESYPIHDN